MCVVSVFQTFHSICQNAGHTESSFSGYCLIQIIRRLVWVWTFFTCLRLSGRALERKKNILRIEHIFVNIIRCNFLMHFNYSTSGNKRPIGDVGTDIPPTRETTPLQSTVQCIFPLAGSIILGARLQWLTVELRLSIQPGTKRDPRRLSLSSNVLCSSSAKSFSEPKSRALPWKLKRLARLFLLGEKRDPRMLRRDWKRDKNKKN